MDEDDDEEENAKPSLYQVVEQVQALGLDVVRQLQPATTAQDSQRDDKKPNKAAETVLPNIMTAVPQIDCLDEENRSSIESAIVQLEKSVQEEEDGESIFHRASKLYKLGTLYRYAGRFQEALTNFASSIQLMHKNIDLYWQRHLVYLAYGDKDKAMKELTVIIGSTKSYTAFRSKADILFSLKQYDEAALNYSSALIMQPDDVKCLFRRAMSRVHLKEMVLAIQDFENVLRLDRNNYEAVRHMGRFYFAEKRYERCIKCFDDIASALPRDIEVFVLKGQSFEALSMHQDAMRCYCQAIHLDPDNSFVYYRRGCLLRRLSPPRAIIDFSLSLIVDDSFANIGAFFHRGLAYIQNKEFGPAVADFQCVIATERIHRLIHAPKDLAHWTAMAACQIGLIYMNENNDADTAIKAFNRALEADPTYTRALVCRAQCYYRLHCVSEPVFGYIRKAIRDYSRAIHFRPLDPELQVHRGRLLLEAEECLFAAAAVVVAVVVG
jgi:tetratricopeptide (TPR) repeat protein